MIVLSSLLAALGADLYRTHRSAGVENGLRLIGESAMTQVQLRETVVSNHLLVYWAGPADGSNYLLETIEANVIVLTVLSGGNDPNVSGFINADGNSVFYTSLDPKNVFVGIRGKDIEVQIFYPAQGTSLEMATAAGRLVPITKATG